jgi:hypothetical protein
MESLATSLTGLSADLQAQASRPKYTLLSERPLLRYQRVSEARHIQDRYAIKLALVLSTLGTLGVPQNILRLAPSPTSSHCHPCLEYTPSASGAGMLRMKHSGPQWTSTLDIWLPVQTVAETVYVDMSLVDRVQRFSLYHGTAPIGTNKVESSYYVHTGPYDPASAHYLYLASGSSAAAGFYDASTLQLTHTIMNSARAAFGMSAYSSLPLTNSIRNNFTAVTLLEDASSLTAYSSMYTSASTLSPNGPRPGLGSACFNGESALIHNVVENRLVLDGTENTGHTACLWFNRTGPFDTLFPTLLDGTGEIRFYAFFNDVSFNPHGIFPTDVRASPPSLAHASTNTWTHVCATSEINQPAHLYINGTQVSAETSASVMAGRPAQRPLALGGSSDASLHSGYGVDRGVRACVSDVMLWGRALSAAEVQTVHQNYMSALLSL